MKLCYFTLILLTTSFPLIHCGNGLPDEGGSGSYGADGSEGSELGTADQSVLVGSPFEGRETGDHFEWGQFIREPYQTAEVTSLPIPLFLAYFTASEEENIKEGIQIANDAVGFEAFRVVNDWSFDARPIYKVDTVYFEDDSVSGLDDFGNVVGYTYNRNVYIDGKYDAGRVVTDFAIEIRSDYVNKWIIAHELGHAMGIQSHELIDYKNDVLIPLEEHSLMAAVIPFDPELTDYEYMMQMQGGILLEYMGE